MQRKGTILAGMFAAVLIASGLTWGLTRASELQSGVPVGGMLVSYRPRHVSGADKGTDTCPLCQYPDSPAVQVWVNGDDDNNIAALAGMLAKASAANRHKKLKAFIVYVNASHQADGPLAKRLEVIAAKSGAKDVAFAYIHGGDIVATRDNEIDTSSEVKNTVFVYKARKVTAKFINLVADKQGIGRLGTAIDQVMK